MELLIMLANLARLDKVLNLFAKAFPRKALGYEVTGFGDTKIATKGEL
jgi:hypothetical protein